ncbi:MAG: hypothetical protein EBU96_11935, partial [Actinobacteria bacterium]|nr:hypothetical protein [Actinomycetota bacterium]
MFIKGDSIRFEPTSINARDIPAATIFQSYEPVSMTSTGTAPTSWSATGLPDGMSMSSSGELQGTPRVSGNFNFTVNAMDESDAILASQAFSILVNDIPQKQPVTNIVYNLVGTISWVEPSDAVDGMTYDVLWGINPNSMQYLKTCNNVDIQGTSNTSEYTCFNADTDVEYYFSIIAHWPDEGYSRTDFKRFSSRSICTGASTCQNPSWDRVNSAIDDATTANGNGDAFDGALRVYV